MLEKIIFNQNIGRLRDEIKISKEFISNLKDSIGKPFNKLEYYGDPSKRESFGKDVLDKIEKHYFFDEMYFAKMVGLLESLHIHLLSDNIINNEIFKDYIFEKYEVLSTKRHFTGHYSGNLYIKSDRGLTEYLATKFFPGQIKAGCLGATSLLSERTLNAKVYDQIMNKNFRKNCLTIDLEEINQLHIEIKGIPLFFFKEYDDFVNLTEIISELRNRIVHRNFEYDFSSIVTVKNEKFTNFQKKGEFDDESNLTIEEICPNASAREIKVLKEKSYQDDELEINMDLVNYLMGKKLLIDTMETNPNYFPFTDNNILQLFSGVMAELVLESVFIHEQLYDKFLKELN